MFVAEKNVSSYRTAKVTSLQQERKSACLAYRIIFSVIYLVVNGWAQMQHQMEIGRTALSVDPGQTSLYCYITYGFSLLYFPNTFFLSRATKLTLCHAL